MSVDELDDVVRLAEIESQSGPPGDEYAEVQPAHLLIAIASSTRSEMAKVRSGLRGRVNGRRVPLSPGARALLDTSVDRVSLLAALRERGPTHVRAAAREVEVTGGR